jgi:sigma-B regulation protein RsbU (phosphoserine phosphatase)
VCHDPIEPERLAADPLTCFCIDHLTRSEARALEQDLELAGRVQQGLLPPKLMVDQGWEIAHVYRPLGTVSGDYCDVVRPPSADGGVLFLFGDISGKGVASSMLMAHLHATARTLAGLDLPLPQILERANRVFCDSTMTSHYATLVCGRLSPAGSLEICNAGHCPPILVCGRSVTQIDAHGVPIGLFCLREYGMSTFQLAPGDRLVLYTDGLSEAKNVADEDFGPARLADLARDWRDDSASALASTIVERAAAHRGRMPRADDESVMVIRRIQ